MLYHYLRFANYIFTVFGIRKPFLSLKKSPSKVLAWNVIWSLAVIASLIFAYIVSNKSTFTFGLKNNLNNIHITNDIVINVLIIILYLLRGEDLSAELYKGIQKILDDFHISELNIKMISMKIYLFFIITTTIMISFIVQEIVLTKKYILLITFPTYLSIFHLVLHLYVISVILNLMTLKMFDVFNHDLKQQRNNYIEKSNKSKWKYLLSTDLKFYEVDTKVHFEIKDLCRIYDDLATCIQLLEQYHGVQMILTYWLMFTTSVFGITLIACDESEDPVIDVARSILPFLWCFIGSFISNQISGKVEMIDIIIIKCLMDFRCDQSKKNSLQTFKQLIGAKRLEFTACSLFHLNYNTILGTAVNIITYSVILIQLFWDK